MVIFHYLLIFHGMTLPEKIWIQEGNYIYLLLSITNKAVVKKTDVILKS